MNPLVIEHVPCPVCEAAIGQECHPDSHGMRLDDFIANAPYEARLQMYQETAEWARKKFADQPELLQEMVEDSLCLTSEELAAL